MDPLDGARLKVVWADKHLDSLKSEVATFLNTHPYRLVADDDMQYWRVYPRADSVPDPIKLIAGDCIACLRAALDYIAWALAVRWAGRPLAPPPAGDDKPYFPLFNSRGAFHSVVVKDKRGLAKRFSIPAPTLSELDSAQPYPGRNQALWYLYLLVNHDKHRLPVLGVTVVSGADVFVCVHGRWTQLASGMTDDPRLSLPVGYTAGNPLMSNDVQMHIKATGFVSFDDVAVPREPIDVTLGDIIKTVKDLIPKFVPFV